jgi:hypothetical protein
MILRYTCHAVCGIANNCGWPQPEKCGTPGKTYDAELQISCWLHLRMCWRLQQQLDCLDTARAHPEMWWTRNHVYNIYLLISWRPHLGMCSTKNNEICLASVIWCGAHLGMYSTLNRLTMLTQCRPCLPKSIQEDFRKTSKGHMTMNLVFPSSIQFSKVTSPRKRPCVLTSVVLQHLSECLQSLWRQIPRSIAELCPICIR